MSETKTTTRRIRSAEESQGIPAYDLLGQERQAHDALQILNQQRRLLSQMVGGCFSRLFNGLSCQMDYAPFRLRRMDDAAGQAEWLWLQADGGPGRRAWVAMEVRQLFRLAILFFGGSLLKGDSKAVARPPSETEQRLLLRLGQHQLDILSDLLGEPETRWNLTLVDSDSVADPGMWLCSEGTLMLGEHDSQFLLWWPLGEPDLPQLPNPAGGLSVQLQAALPAVPVRLRVVLSEFSLSLGELQQLQAGDVLSLDLPELVPALIGPHPCFSGRMAEHNGTLVYQVASVNQA